MVTTADKTDKPKSAPRKKKDQEAHPPESRSSVPMVFDNDDIQALSIDACGAQIQQFGERHQTDVALVERQILQAVA